MKLDITLMNRNRVRLRKWERKVVNKSEQKYIESNDSKVGRRRERLDLI